MFIIAPSRAWLIGLTALFLFALGFPVLLWAAGLPSRQQVYWGMPPRFGTYSVWGHEFFDKNQDVDLLFIGSSTTFAAIDPKLVEANLSRKLRRPANVIVCGWTFPGMDIAYYLLRDLLQHRRVRQVVISVNEFDAARDKPHFLTYLFVRFGDDLDLFMRMRPIDQVKLYANFVLGAPRQALNRLRSNPPFDYDRAASVVESLGTDHLEAATDSDVPLLRPEQWTYSPATAARFEFGSAVTGYQMFYLRRIAALLRSGNVNIAMLNIPTEQERRATVVHEYFPWPQLFGPQTVELGLPPERLFARLPDGTVDRLFRDPLHFSSAGRTYFTKSALPAILSLFDR